MTLLLLTALLAAAQDDLPPVHYPTLPAAAKSAAGFAPRGWAVEQQVKGDLDGDGIPDLAFALHQQDKRNIIPNEGGMCGETIDTNPRILGFALADGKGGYALVVQNHSLVPRYDSPCADDWFAADNTAASGLSLGKGSVKVTLGRFMSAGGWSMGSTVFTFRWQAGALRLIGYDYDNVQRNSGETQSLSINYATRKARIGHGTIESDHDKMRWQAIKVKTPPSIDQIGDGMMFDPEGLVSKL